MIEKISIKRLVRILVLFVAFHLTFFACTDDHSNNANYFDDINGFWIGKKTIHQAGSCSISGGSTLSLNSLLKINIDEEGLVEVNEYYYRDSSKTYYYVDDIKYLWKGTINKEYSFEINKPLFVTCFGEPRESSSQYKSTVMKANDDYTLHVSSTEEWCPMRGCTFITEYELRHTDSTITNIQKFDESSKSRLTSTQLYRVEN